MKFSVRGVNVTFDTCRTISMRGQMLTTCDTCRTIIVSEGYHMLVAVMNLINDSLIL